MGVDRRGQAVTTASALDSACLETLTLMVSLLTTKIQSERLFQGFLTVATITAIAGVFLLILWWRDHRSSRNVVVEIKNRLPPPPAIPQTDPESAGT